MGIKKMKVNSLLKDIEKYMRDLESLFPVDIKRIKDDLKLRYSVAFLIEQIVNECINLGNHILSNLDLETPSTFAEVFENLSKANLISERASSSMVELVEVRNIIAHRYGKISDSKLVETAKKLDCVKEFLDELVGNLEREIKDEGGP
jgi:uncharacterized protein YutE (UPF0331/DUF86 family)